MSTIRWDRIMRTLSLPLLRRPLFAAHAAAEQEAEQGAVDAAAAEVDGHDVQSMLLLLFFVRQGVVAALAVLVVDRQIHGLHLLERVNAVEWVQFVVQYQVSEVLEPFTERVDQQPTQAAGVVVLQLAMGQGMFAVFVGHERDRGREVSRQFDHDRLVVDRCLVLEQLSFGQLAQGFLRLFLGDDLAFDGVGNDHLAVLAVVDGELCAVFEYDEAVRDARLGQERMLVVGQKHVRLQRERLCRMAYPYRRYRNRMVLRGGIII